MFSVLCFVFASPRNESPSTYMVPDISPKLGGNEPDLVWFLAFSLSLPAFMSLTRVFQLEARQTNTICTSCDVGFPCIQTPCGMYVSGKLGGAARGFICLARIAITRCCLFFVLLPLKESTLGPIVVVPLLGVILIRVCIYVYFPCVFDIFCS